MMEISTCEKGGVGMRTYHKQMEVFGGAPSLARFVGEKLQAAGKSCRTLGLLALATVLLGACAGQQMDRPVAQLTRVESAIENAVQAGARQQAPVELQSAQRHFSQAQRASSEQEFADAMRLAEKAEADAQLAEAKARRAMTENDLAELQEGIRVLQEELGRSPQ
jgi:hypothetical protein